MAQVPATPGTPEFGFLTGAGGAGGGTNWNQLFGLGNLANLGTSFMSMANTGSSLGEAYKTGGLFSDINFGQEAFKSALDYARQQEAPRLAARIQVDDPYVRQFGALQAMRNPGIAGRWSSFVG